MQEKLVFQHRNLRGSFFLYLYAPNELYKIFIIYGSPRKNMYIVAKVEKNIFKK